MRQRTALHVFPHVFLIVGTALVVLASCGIPTTSFIGPPKADDIQSTSTPPTVLFTHNAADNGTDDFLGYEVYYKFYRSEPDALNAEFGDDLQVVTDAAAVSGTGTLETRGFHRVWDAADDVGSLPLIPIASSESGDSFVVTLRFPDKASAASPEPAAAQYLGRTVYLSRDPALLPTGADRGFESVALHTDPPDGDVPPGIPGTDTILHVGIAILAYGADNTGGTFGILYSGPVMVGEPLELILE